MFFSTQVCLTRGYGKPLSPKEICDHSAIYDPISKQMIVFGGLNQDGQLLSDIWTYDIEKKTWEKREVTMMAHNKKSIGQ